MTNHVKIHGVIPRIQYTADGILTAFEFPFAIFDSDDINVYLNDQLQSAQSYTVSGIRNSDGGIVTFATAPSIDTIITIVRNLSIERTTDFQEGGALRANVLNDELDYQIACQQQLADNLNRSMVLPPYAADINVDLTLPLPEAGKAIVWNSSGTNLENSTVSVNALESTLRGYKTAAETAANTASGKASIATTQAGIATEKATQATSAANRLNGFQSNCIIEIPQNIKLELNSGTLTLKSGSIFTLPNGNQSQTTEDKTYSSIVSGNTVLMIALQSNGSAILARPLENCVSGANATTTKGFAFNTTTNTINEYTSTGALSNTCSLPIAIVTVTSGTITKIDKVFNGFGYIGSSIFVLPGVKYLATNGLNADGTLKSTAITLNNLVVRHFSLGNGNYTSWLNHQGQIGNTYSNQVAYDPKGNYIVSGNNNTIGCLFVDFTINSNMITSFNPKTAFHAVDYHNFSDLSDHVSTISSYNHIVFHAETSYTWVRVWSDGFIEQGGYLAALSEFDDDTEYQLTFPRAFSGTNYMISKNLGKNSSGSTYFRDAGFYSLTTTGAKTYAHGGSDCRWYACGY